MTEPRLLRRRFFAEFLVFGTGPLLPERFYQLLRFFSSYSFMSGKATSTITARFDNATNELYRNHLSLIKDLTPEMGRNFKLLYNVTF